MTFQTHPRIRMATKVSDRGHDRLDVESRPYPNSQWLSGPRRRRRRARRYAANELARLRGAQGVSISLGTARIVRALWCLQTAARPGHGGECSRLAVEAKCVDFFALLLLTHQSPNVARRGAPLRRRCEKPQVIARCVTRSRAKGQQEQVRSGRAVATFRDVENVTHSVSTSDTGVRLERRRSTME